jgi:hypothetical protein
MNKFSLNKFRLLAAILVPLLIGIANAKDYRAGALEIDRPWSRAIQAGTANVEFTVEAIGATSPAAEGMPSMPHAHH